MPNIRTQVAQTENDLQARRVVTLSREAVLYDEVRTRVRVVTTDHTFEEGDYMVICDVDAGDMTLTLPLAALYPGWQFAFRIRDTGATGNSITVAVSGSDTTNDTTPATALLTGITLSSPGQPNAYQLNSDGVLDWSVI